MIPCWCGSTDLHPFSPDYVRCTACGTIVSQGRAEGDLAHPQDDGSDLYGKDYWFGHQVGDLSQPDIISRSRLDLPERCLDWLAVLVKHCPPPARVLELGCAHGGFVALMRLAGYDATGIELSPTIAGYARTTFGIPVLQGPLEEQGFPDGSFDAVVSFDVVEHLPDPIATLRACRKVLKPGGVLLIQTPEVPEPTDPAIAKPEHPFAKVFMPREHLNLFTAASLRQVLSKCGFPVVHRERPVFPDYDGFVVARSDGTNDMSPGYHRLEDHLVVPSARFALALLDLRKDHDLLLIRLRQALVDADTRLQEMERLGRLLETSEADRAARLQEMERLGRLLETSEADRAARLDVINALQARLKHP
jgi:SAM-dependent methyltransferase